MGFSSRGADSRAWTGVFFFEIGARSAAIFLLELLQPQAGFDLGKLKLQRFLVLFFRIILVQDLVRFRSKIRCSARALQRRREILAIALHILVSSSSGGRAQESRAGRLGWPRRLGHCGKTCQKAISVDRRESRTDESEVQG
jgi:hypothetical protein